MNTDTPLVSVVVPSYNHERFISKCIGSILNQSFTNFELIVIDDGSTDGSRAILTSLKEKNNFTLVLQDNIGCAATFNKAIKEYAKGNYFTFCASDDYWMPYKLEKQVAFMELNPHIPMCYGKAYIIDDDNNIMWDVTAKFNRNLKGGNIFKDILVINYHPPVNYLLRKHIFDDVGYYREDILTEDFYMNLRISQKYSIGYIDEYLSYYRSPRNHLLSHRSATIRKTTTAHLKCINEYKDSKYYPEAIRKWHFRNFRFHSAFSRDKYFAFKAMLHSLRYFFKPHYLASIARLMLVWK